MTTITKISLGIAACSLSLPSLSTAATSVFGGGAIKTAGNWSLGLPDATDDGSISVDGTVTGNFNSGGTNRFVDATITQDAGTITGIFNTAGAAGLVWNLTDGTLAGGSGNFNANSGTIFNLSGGELVFGADLIVNNSAGGFNVSGDAIISTTSDFDVRLNQDNAFFNIADDWTGSFVSGNDATAADWITEFVTGVGDAGIVSTNNNATRFISIGGNNLTRGVEITAANFNDYFVVTPDGNGGSTLTLVPEPSSTALLGLGGLALLMRRRK